MSEAAGMSMHCKHATFLEINREALEKWNKLPLLAYTVACSYTQNSLLQYVVGAKMTFKKCLARVMEDKNINGLLLKRAALNLWDRRLQALEYCLIRNMPFQWASCRHLTGHYGKQGTGLDLVGHISSDALTLILKEYISDDVGSSS